MAKTHGSSKKRVLFSGYVASPSSGDGADGFCIPFAAAHLTYFGFALDVGGTSGNNDVMLNRVRNESDTELLSAVLRVAHDADPANNQTNSFVAADNVLQQGDIVRIDLDASAGSNGGFSWVAEVHIDQN